MPLLGTIAIYLASLFSLYSALEYSLGLIRKIRKENKQKKIKSQQKMSK
jgi:CDP-diacylglycerol--glycerol-3-phosphate 3-phosphatidyltransferase